MKIKKEITNKIHMKVLESKLLKQNPIMPL